MTLFSHITRLRHGWITMDFERRVRARELLTGNLIPYENISGIVRCDHAPLNASPASCSSLHAMRHTSDPLHLMPFRWLL